jgi:LCP family protein required for cell wall assembly
MTERDLGPPKHAQPKRGRAGRWLKRLVIGLLSVSLLVGAGGYLYVKHLESNIAIIPPDPGKQHRPDPGPSGPLNILLLGSDERVAGGGVAGQGGDLSDTTILLHLSADRTRAYGVSIPRDLLVDRPTCAAKDGKGPDVPGATQAMFNTAFQVGGPNCTWRLVESMTGVRVDHVVVVNFAGFKRMVDALHGVPVCVPKAIDDYDHGIHLKAGSYDISGNDALTYVRARYRIGDGTDIGRIQRQQAFLAAMTNKAVSLGTLINPAKLFPFLEAVTSSIETDAGLANLGKLKSLAGQLKSIGLSHVKFVTMPIAIPTDDINRRIPAPQAAAVWLRIKNDQPLTREQLTGSINAAHVPGGTPTGTPATTPTSEAAAREAVGLCP